MLKQTKGKAGRLNLNAGDFVRLVTSHGASIQGDFAFKERATLLDFAVTFALRFEATTEVCDELVMQSLRSASTGGMRYALLLAPRASMKARKAILCAMFSFFGLRNVNQIASYAKEFLGRDLTLEECTTMRAWFNSCPNESDKEERRKFLKYVQEKFPKQINKFTKYFQSGDQFWEGAGSIL